MMVDLERMVNGVQGQKELPRYVQIGPRICHRIRGYIASNAPISALDVCIVRVQNNYINLA